MRRRLFFQGREKRKKRVITPISPSFNAREGCYCIVIVAMAFLFPTSLLSLIMMVVVVDGAAFQTTRGSCAGTKSKNEVNKILSSHDHQYHKKRVKLACCEETRSSGLFWFGGVEQQNTRRRLRTLDDAAYRRRSWWPSSSSLGRTSIWVLRDNPSNENARDVEVEKAIDGDSDFQDVLDNVDVGEAGEERKGANGGGDRNNEEETIVHPDHVSPPKAVSGGEDEGEEDLLSCPLSVPAAGFTVHTDAEGGPGGSEVHTLTIHLGARGHPEPLVFEVGKIGRQAAGAVTLTRGDTVLYSTACRDKDPKDASFSSMDFIPLSVEYQERFSSVGSTSGSYNRRDGRPAEHEVLTCRLIDRPIRPMITKGWTHETQVLSWILSFDGKRDADPLAVTASAAAVYLSDIPLLSPVAAVVVGLVDNVLVLNPTRKQMERSRLDLTVAGTKDAVLMIEGCADFLPEETILDAVAFGHQHLGIICDGLVALGQQMSVTKKMDTIPQPIPGLKKAVSDLMTERIDESLVLPGGKVEHSAAMSEMSKYVVSELADDFPDLDGYIKDAFKSLYSHRMYLHAKKTGKRIDGRALDAVRGIDCEVGFLPRVHGSALFTRGDTQTVATATLGDSGMRQKIDKIEGLEQKRFYFQYSFPPSCVGETGRVGTPGRREVGHGNLAERALAATVPSEEDFPYSIRVESLITESHGSSSMASVCGGCLALMDAGVPVKRTVAGIAMGMLLSEEKGNGEKESDDDNGDDCAIIVSDLLGSEDALGTMDFKVAGDREGITAFQLDVKCEGLTMSTLKRALMQAREGRLHILDKIEQTLHEPKSELPPSVPRIASFRIPVDRIGRVIGPGGKQIRAITDDFGLANVDVQDDGTVQMSGMESDRLKEAQTFVEKLVSDSPSSSSSSGNGGGKGVAYTGPPAEVGKTYSGIIKGVHPFGVFLEILPPPEDGSSAKGLEGLCHVSELHVERVRNCEAYVASLKTDALDVKYLGTNDRGQIQLSRKAVMEERQQDNSRGNSSGNNSKRGGGSGNGNANNNRRQQQRKQKMTKEEVDVIAQAIEDITAL